MEEKEYIIEQMDNGWVLRDESACVHQVVQEEVGDRKNTKTKIALGAWLLEDIGCFFDKEMVSICRVKIKIEKKIIK